MPFRLIDGFRFGFFSLDRVEPPHVHVMRGGAQAKIWLNPIEVAYNRGYNSRELNRVVELTRQYQAELLEMWHDHFNH